ncbi:MAG TPA: winged helix-turn-helix transcriptional regulator [Solirubrobacterales bacterium]|nr:winged helix-turn-helix transcriptional regulator [Solirubrobacterales bacterium]
MDVEPQEPQTRAGGRALTILAAPLNLQVLRALSERPMRLAELRKATGLPAQTTLRGHLATLVELGVVQKRPTQQMPYAVENELTPLGRGLLDVAGRLEAWLKSSPDGAIPLESAAAKGAIKALVDGWESKMMRALAARPLSLTQLDRLISDFSYPALERRLASMRLAGLVEGQRGQGGGTPYAVTDWARFGVAPLAAASHCERVHMSDHSAPVTQIDIEAGFLLATPLVGLSRDVAGSCQLEVEASPGVVPRPAGVQVTVERGRVVSCVSRLQDSPGAFASGTALKWFYAVKDGKVGELSFGGSGHLAEELVGGLHTAFVKAGVAR